MMLLIVSVTPQSVDAIHKLTTLARQLIVYYSRGRRISVGFVENIKLFTIIVTVVQILKQCGH